MPILRKRKTQTDPNPEAKNDQNPKISLYEESREERIKENLERMQKLGLKDLSLNLKSSLSPPKRTPRNNPFSTKHPSALLPSGPTRRSSRLQNVTPVSYSEAVLAKKGGPLEDEVVKLEECSKPEVYTEVHEKLLGNTDRSWTLFVDGYGKDGKRIYDQVNGKTCHQCRQKTLGYHTHCSDCKIVQGQFCGDCLYMRYGEHVLEAIENPNWICPVCRGICNCSLCRHAKGWAPTGPLYRKISSLGYKSVAHYLIQTRRLQNNEGKNLLSNNQVSAKRSLCFSDMEPFSKESSEVSDKQVGPVKPQSMNKMHDEFNSEKMKQIPIGGNSISDDQTKRSLTFSSSAEFNHEVHDNLGISKPKFEDIRDDVFKGEEQKEFHFTDEEHGDNNIVLESCPEVKKKCRLALKPNPDGIGARLRQRRGKGNGHELTGVNEKNSDVKQEVNSLLSNQEVKNEKERDAEDDKPADSTVALEKPACASEPSPDSIGGRLRQRRSKGNGHDDAKLTEVNEKNPDVEDDKHADSTVTYERSASHKKKPACATEPSPDSIGGRLQQRRRMGKGYVDLLGSNGQTSDVQQVFNISPGKEGVVNMKLTSTTKPSEDSIARRLRPRHKTT